MAINSYKMGPGTLTLGTAGEQDVSCQLTTCTVNPSENVTEEEDIDVLCGETLEGEDEVTFDFTLSGTLLQDISANGVVDYTWANMGTYVDFKFVPNTAEARQVTGQVRLVPLSIGGEVKQRATSDFEWAIQGTPVFDALAA